MITDSKVDEYEIKIFYVYLQYVKYFSNLKWVMTTARYHEGYASNPLIQEMIKTSTNRPTPITEIFGYQAVGKRFLMCTDRRH